MRIANLFSKSETAKLTGLAEHKLKYLDRLGLIKATKFGREGQKSWWYRWEDLIALKAYAKLREHCSLQALRDAFDYLKLDNPIQHISDKRLFAFSKKVYWVNLDNPEYAEVISGIQKGQGAFLIVIAGDELLQEIWSAGENNVIDFAERAKEKPRSSQETLSAVG